MPAYVRCLFIFAIISLSACSDYQKIADMQKNIIQLTEEKEELRLSLQNLQDRTLVIEKQNHDLLNGQAALSAAAAVAQVCKLPFNINICPDSWTKAGEEAILKNAAAGGDSPVYWSLWGMRLSVFVFVGGLLIVIPLDYWSRRLKPNLDAHSKGEEALFAQRNELVKMNDALEFKEKELESFSIMYTAKSQGMREVIREFNKDVLDRNQQISALQEAQLNLETENAALEAKNNRLKAFKL